jgi:hypothetical protein
VVTLGKMNDALQWAREMNEVAAKRGWPKWRTLMPGFGKVNALILEIEYPDLTAMTAHDEAFYADAEMMKVFRRGTELNAPGSHPWDELEIEAPEKLA